MKYALISDIHSNPVAAPHVPKQGEFTAAVRHAPCPVLVAWDGEEAKTAASTGRTSRAREVWMTAKEGSSKMREHLERG